MPAYNAIAEPGLCGLPPTNDPYPDPLGNGLHEIQTARDPAGHRQLQTRLVLRQCAVIPVDVRSAASTDTPLYTLRHQGAIMDDLRAPWLLLPHGELHTLLYDLAVGAGVEFRFHAEVVHVDPQRPSIRLASGEAWIGDLVVGADGHNGIVRKVVAGEEPPVPPPRTASLRYARCFLLHVGQLTRVTACRFLRKRCETTPSLRSSYSKIM
jgi:2-polyprenyl-6-methoxyphenol hydroxylase-like FAD-dependent oxidoreductase